MKRLLLATLLATNLTYADIKSDYTTTIKPLSEIVQTAIDDKQPLQNIFNELKSLDADMLVVFESLLPYAKQKDINFLVNETIKLTGDDGESEVLFMLSQTTFDLPKQYLTAAGGQPEQAPVPTRVEFAIPAVVRRSPLASPN